MSLEHALDEADPAGAQDVLAIDEALVRLAELDPAQARIVELRFFAGLTVEETAHVVECSPEPSNASGGWHGLGCSGNSSASRRIDDLLLACCPELCPNVNVCHDRQTLVGLGVRGAIILPNLSVPGGSLNRFLLPAAAVVLAAALVHAQAPAGSRPLSAEDMNVTSATGQQALVNQYLCGLPQRSIEVG